VPPQQHSTCPRAPPRLCGMLTTRVAFSKVNKLSARLHVDCDTCICIPGLPPAHTRRVLLQCSDQTSSSLTARSVCRILCSCILGTTRHYTAGEGGGSKGAAAAGEGGLTEQLRATAPSSARTTRSQTKVRSAQQLPLTTVVRHCAQAWLACCSRCKVQGALKPAQVLSHGATRLRTGRPGDVHAPSPVCASTALWQPAARDGVPGRACVAQAGTPAVGRCSRFG
jgi:hypothetical protein